MRQLRPWRPGSSAGKCLTQSSPCLGATLLARARGRRYSAVFAVGGRFRRPGNSRPAVMAGRGRGTGGGRDALLALSSALCRGVADFTGGPCPAVSPSRRSLCSGGPAGCCSRRRPPSSSRRPPCARQASAGGRVRRRQRGGRAAAQPRAEPRCDERGDARQRRHAGVPLRPRRSPRPRRPAHAPGPDGHRGDGTRPVARLRRAGHRPGRTGGDRRTGLRGRPHGERRGRRAVPGPRAGRTRERTAAGDRAPLRPGTVRSRAAGSARRNALGGQSSRARQPGRRPVPSGQRDHRSGAAVGAQGPAHVAAVRPGRVRVRHHGGPPPAAPVAVCLRRPSR